MPRTKLNTGNSHWTEFPEVAALFILLTGFLSVGAMAQQPGQKTFSSPEEASMALFAAVQSNDKKALLVVLGPDARQLISSGDEAEDAHGRADFVQAYLEMHRLVKEPDGTTTLYIGAKNWPTPIPLVQKGSEWYFDTDAGKREILYRRVGRNELSAIQVCQDLVAAQREYRRTQGGEYAQKITSDEGKHDGLYWKAAAAESQSPIGPLVASAVAKGYASDGVLTPYRGYYFHILTSQGRNAPGGAKSYIVDGKMTEGFAFVAFPAQYRSSGVMTFIVGSDGVVYEKDLGKDTDSLGQHMKTYDPDATWRKAEQQSTRDPP
jgi:hypothetical protein